jgi:predicted flap endonuclease-1-like 5' DNA nuclease
VKQLTRLGITRYDQIATLSESDLDDPEHPLHAMKGRVIKDDWIAQAARLAGA